MADNQEHGQLNRAARRHGLAAHPSVDGTTPIMLDRERHLSFDLEAAEGFQTDTGINVLEKGLPFLTPPDAGLIGKFLWYSLRHEDPELTIEQVRHMVGLHNLYPVISAISGMYLASVPKAVVESLRPLVVKHPSSPIGENSGPSGDMTSDSPTANSGDSPGDSSVAS